MMERYELEDKEQWRKWIKEIPALEFKKGWRVKVIPPFSGAIARFQVETKDGGWTSVYLDVFENLGYFGEPYWEVYPHDGGVARCAMNDTKKLIKLISQSLKERERSI